MFMNLLYLSFWWKQNHIATFPDTMNSNLVAASFAPSGVTRKAFSEQTQCHLAVGFSTEAPLELMFPDQSFLSEGKLVKDSELKNFLK